MEESLQVYVKTGDSSQLVTDMAEYINHVMQHVWKENNRLFMMADMALQDQTSEVNQGLLQMEESKLKDIGKSREDYEKIVEELDKKISTMS